MLAPNHSHRHSAPHHVMPVTAMSMKVMSTESAAVHRTVAVNLNAGGAARTCHHPPRPVICGGGGRASAAHRVD